MALPDKALTSGQTLVVDPLIANFNAAKARLDGAQKLYNEALVALDEYSKQAAEKLAIDVVTDYTFDVNAKKFIDKAAVVDAQKG